jgi:hypothetical protein
MVKIIFISMIKNEEKIIERCFTNALSFCDAICVTDTGSTDKTCEIVSNLFKTISIPAKLYHDKWKDFGHNRSNSFNNTVAFCKELGWDLNTTYGLLLDADMVLKVVNFDKEQLKDNGYKIIQKNSAIEYYNTRFIKIGYPWKCTGVTHEYWDGCECGTISIDKIYIDDIGDGGAKNDKFDRDVRLLTQGLKDEPNNARYLFYLAQTLKDTGKFKESIKLYKKRIQIGGWQEEVWYSYYMIGKCWLGLKDKNKFECWMNRAYEYRKERAEPLYDLTRYFREQSNDQFKAYQYFLMGVNIPYPKNDVLFIENHVYNKYLFELEQTILYYYVYPNDRLTGLKKSIEYLNKYDFQTEIVYSNVDHYIGRILDMGEAMMLNQPIYQNDYIPTSTSLMKYKNQIIANVRYVNYRIQSDGSYIMSKNNVLSRDEFVRTKNAILKLDNKFKQESNLILMNERLDTSLSKQTNILGLEDIRLFEIDNKIKCIATSREYSTNSTNSMVICDYDINNYVIENLSIIESPNHGECEKNWIPINNKIIYKWFPLEIGSIINNKLVIEKSIKTPTFFKNLRGSSNVVEYENSYWTVVHGVKYHAPRKYYHVIIVLDKNYEVKKYTVPFYFDTYAIEYCLGLLIEDNTMYISVSRNDSNPIICKIDIKQITKLFL